MSDIGWRFPSVDGGNQDGFRDAGIETYRGAAGYSGLAREIIQNSLDACLSEDSPVEMAFEVRDWPIEAIGGQELAVSFRACRDATDKEEAPEEWDFFDKGVRRLTGELGETVKVLVISDRNTTGLPDPNWKALLKERGRSKKAVPGSGGSFGIGRNAAFCFSEIRTVFYWTALRKGGSVTQRFQGKSVLKSHESKRGMTQGTGYWGRTEECHHVCEKEIPEELLPLHEWNEQGTTVCIVGFYPDDLWQTEMLKSVACNYFFAIAKGRLNVLIRPGPNEQVTTIGKENLSDRIRELASALPVDREVQKSRTFLSMTTTDQADTTVCQTKELPVLGKCSFLIRTRNLPENTDVKRVGFIRNPGLLITDTQRTLKIPRDMNDFLGIFLCENTEGNEFLRKIENPQHDQFEINRITNQAKRSAAQSVMAGAYAWIIKCIKETCAKAPLESGAVLDELAEYIPFRASEPFDTKEKDFDGDPIKVSERSKEVSISLDPPSTPPEIPDPPPDPPSPKRRLVGISDVRMLPVKDGGPNSRLICFDPSESGDVAIEVYVVGDTSDTPVGKTSATTEKGVRARIPFHSKFSLERTLAIRVWAVP